MTIARSRLAAISALLLVATSVAPALGQDADGAQLFADNCAACHNDGGTGNPGLAPPLNRPAFWDALGDKAPDYLAGVLASGLTGKITVDGEMYVGLIMPAQTALSEQEAATVANWVLHEAGRDAPDEALPKVTPDLIAKTFAAPPAAHDLLAMRPKG
ncbi:c-type cytochrome [Paracoccus aestuariivivens]|uniref:C-type cytochrome n=1 Tax=Paracoccus aestuariivivens TaxID=1820333 RepID=A0A6L6JBM0_9RHOB|nr:cytochrome c [Paracoccus aestuariivivens]MTH78027.1 c-type cytochrome [Paracoccus aestuariivivens]